MAWECLGGPALEVTIYPNGQIAWGEGFQQALGRPRFVLMFQDGTRLGFQRVSAANGCALGVLFTEDMEYRIDAEVQLGNAGVSLEEPFSATPHAPTPPNPPDDPGDMGIWWIEMED